MVLDGCVVGVVVVDPEMLPRVQVDRGAIKFLLAVRTLPSPVPNTPGLTH